MEFKDTISVQISRKVADTRIHEFFDKVGYSVINENSLNYQRGSLIGSYTSFSPKKWMTKVKTTIEEVCDASVDCSIELSVNTSGQAVTEREKKVFEDEIKELSLYLKGETLELDSNLDIEKSTSLIRIGWLLVFFLIMIAVPITTRGLVDIIFKEVSLQLAFEVLAAPVLSLIFLSGKYKEYRIRVIVLVFSLAGIVGFVGLGMEFLRSYISNGELVYFKGGYWVPHILILTAYFIPYIIFINYQKVSKWMLAFNKELEK